MAINESPLFIPAPVFMVRTPFFPIDYFHKLVEEENTSTFIQTFYSQNKSFQEAIAVASPSLKEEADKNKNTAEVTDSLLKYFSRMTSRCTPFGLFSFVSFGEINENIQSKINLDHVIKRARPDMEWVQNMIETICKEEELFLQLPVQCNPLLTTQGDRFCVGYLIQKLDQKSISIRNTILTKTIFSLTKDSVNVGELLHKILELLPNLVADKVQEVIKTLIAQQFLWFSLLPSLMSSAPFQDFLKKVPFDYSQKLNPINQTIENYSRTDAGEGIDALNKINQSMESFVKSKMYLQVDSANTEMKITLAKHILEEVAEGIEVLWRIPNDEPDTTMKAYFDSFLNKYGTHRLVSLYELLDEARGLGEPGSSASAKSEPSQDISSAKFKQWQQEVLSKCLWEHQQEIEITEEMVKKWSDKPNYKKACPSTDVFFELFAKSDEEINLGHYLISISGNTYQGGSTFGRFLDMFGEDLHQKIIQFYREEEKLDEESIFVESSFLPPSSRSQNVSINPNFRKELIDLSPGGAATISLEDIYVGARNDRLYLTTKNGEKEFYVTASNVLNQISAPAPLRFLRDVSRSKYQMCKGWSWGKLFSMPFLPRVRYKRTILSSARWSVNLERIEADVKDSIPQIIEKFNRWAERYEMPRYTFITEADNKLLIDRTNPKYLELIARLLKKSQSLVFTEKGAKVGDEWLTSDLGKHCAEFIVPLLKNSKYIYPKSSSNVVSTTIPTHIRWKLPGSEWLFAKYYLPREGEKRFLTQHLNPFVDYLKSQQWIDQWFFIRYNDLKPHLRLRLQGNSEVLTQKVLPVLRDWSHNLIHEGLIQEMSLSSYEREVERYGGTELIQMIENFFCADSLTVMELLKIEKKLEMPPHTIGALSALDLLKGLNFDRTMQKAFFEGTGIDKSELAGFKEWRKVLLSPPSPILLEAFEKRSAHLVELAKRLEELQQANQLTATPFSIASSLIHMHCNRLMGTDLKAESKVRAYAGYSLQNPIPEKSA